MAIETSTAPLPSYPASNGNFQTMETRSDARYVTEEMGNGKSKSSNGGGTRKLNYQDDNYNGTGPLTQRATSGLKLM